jgi:hypothetical protein
MSAELFLVVLAALFAALFAWAFRALPQERWQFLAVMPVGKTAAGEWQGLNLTFYGFFQAASNALAAVIMFTLLGAIGVTAGAVFALIAVTFALCWTASKLIARGREESAHLHRRWGGLRGRGDGALDHRGAQRDAGKGARR